MASRRSNDKTPDNSNQIVKAQPASPINTVNRFTTLGTIPKTNYSSVLASTYDPYTLVHSPQPIQTGFPRNPNASQYVKKRYVQNLFSVEPNRASITNPFRLATSYFPPLFHWIPEHNQKTVQYYTAILRQEDSVEINPIRDKNDREKIIYHSLYLKHIISEEMWGPCPTATRSLPNYPIPYSYHDYITAWFRFMLHQNETMSHSWFVNFHKDFDSPFPLWFIRWWTQFGSAVEIFPAQLTDCFRNFSLRFKPDTHRAKFPPLLHFIKKYKTPWILKWQYAKEDDVLARCWYVKWWDRFSHTDSIINNVERDFLASHVSPLKITTPVQTAATDAPASSSTKNIASSTKSKKKSSPLDAIRNDPDALYALLSKMVKDDETPNSDATNSDDEKTSQASVSKDPYYQIYPYPQDWFAHDEEHPED